MNFLWRCGKGPVRNCG